VTRFIFTPASQQDVEQIADYLRTLPRTPALRIGREVQKAIETIAAHPYLGRVDELLTRQSGRRIRRFLCTGYLLFYFVENERVCFVGMLHGKQDIDSIMEKRLG
jgi:plasmid stabilization system protein ParE